MSKHAANKLKEEIIPYADLKVDAEGEKLPELIESRVKSEFIKIRCTPFEKKMVEEFSELDNINITDNFRPVIERIVKVMKKVKK